MHVQQFDRSALSGSETAVGSGSGILNRHALSARMRREEDGRVQNACGRCGATSYKPVMARDASGVMRDCGQYQCVQCKRVFRSLQEWKEGGIGTGH